VSTPAWVLIAVAAAFVFVGRPADTLARRRGSGAGLAWFGLTFVLPAAVWLVIAVIGGSDYDLGSLLYFLGYLASVAAVVIGTLVARVVHGTRRWRRPGSSGRLARLIFANDGAQTTNLEPGTTPSLSRFARRDARPLRCRASPRFAEARARGSGEDAFERRSIRRLAVRGQHELDRQVEQRPEAVNDVVARDVRATAELDVQPAAEV